MFILLVYMCNLKSNFLLLLIVTLDLLLKSKDGPLVDEVWLRNKLRSSFLYFIVNYHQLVGNLCVNNKKLSKESDAIWKKERHLKFTSRVVKVVFFCFEVQHIKLGNFKIWRQFNWCNFIPAILNCWRHVRIFSE